MMMIKNIKKTSSLGLLDFPPSRISVFQACDPRMNTMAFRKYIFCMANQVVFFGDEEEIYILEVG